MVTVRLRIRMALVAWLTLGPALLYLTLEVSRVYVLALIALIAFVPIYAMTRKCPNCAKPLLYNPVKFGDSLTLWMWTPDAPAQCSKCGDTIL